jgi:hypothetical protein
VVCYRCSASRHAIPSDRLVRNPVFSADETFELPRLHRVCNGCVPVLLGAAASPSASGTVDTSVPSSITPSSGGVLLHNETRGSTNRDIDDRFLIECPVCRTDLRQFGDDDVQAIHVANCLEGQSSSPFSGGSRHLGMTIHTAC